MEQSTASSASPDRDRDHMLTRLKGMLENMEIPKELAFAIIKAVTEDDADAKAAIYQQAEVAKMDEAPPRQHTSNSEYFSIDPIDAYSQQQLQLQQLQQQELIHQQPAPTRRRRDLPATDEERSQFLLQYQERHPPEMSPSQKFQQQRQEQVKLEQLPPPPPPVLVNKTSQSKGSFTQSKCATATTASLSTFADADSFCDNECEIGLEIENMSVLIHHKREDRPR